MTACRFPLAGIGFRFLRSRRMSSAKGPRRALHARRVALPRLDGMDAVTGHLRTCRMDSLGLQKKHQPEPLHTYRFPL